MSFTDNSLIISNGILFQLQDTSEFRGYVYRTSADQSESGMTSTANNVHVLTIYDNVTSTISRGDTIDCENGESYYVMREPFRSLSSNLMRIYVKRL